MKTKERRIKNKKSKMRVRQGGQIERKKRGR
jgi:hypothetical protein